MRSKFQLAFVCTISALLFSACSTPAAEPKAMDMDAIKIRIQAMEDAYAAGEKAKDVNAVAAYYSNDAISYSKNEEPASGIEAIKQKIAKNIANDTAGNVSAYKVVDLFGDENSLTEIGSWTLVDPAGKQVDKGHYISIFQRQADSTYKCIRDMSVTATPLKKPM